MKRLLFSALLVAFLLPTSSQGQGTRETYLSYHASGYRYLVVKKSDKVIKEFADPKFNDQSWPTGQTAVGTVNNTTSPPCPLNIPEYVHIEWPSSREVLLRKNVYIPSGAKEVKVGVAIDNGVQVFVNGVDVSGGIQVNIGCAQEDGIVFDVPASALASDGNQVIAVRGNWQNSKSYLDLSITGKRPYTITASAGENGSIDPSGSVNVYSGDDQAFLITADEGYHVNTVTVNGANATGFPKAQPTSAPSSYTYTFQNISANGTIFADFDRNYYTLQATAGANGSVTVGEFSTQPHDGSSDPKYYVHSTQATLTAYAASGYYFTGWTAQVEGVAKVIATDNPLRLTLTKDTVLTAAFEILPDPATFPVTTLSDGGAGSLRDAIGQSNGKPGTDNIVFDGALTGTLELNSPLPVLADGVVITGATDTDGNPLVTIQPSSSFSGNESLPDGFQLSGVFLGFGYTPEHSTISNLIITGFDAAGICIGSDNNTVQGCVITGNDSDGVCIVDGSGNLIGGTEPGQGNRIFANGRNGIMVRELDDEDDIAPPVRNGFLGNSIYGNGALGIDLANLIGGLGITWNRFPNGTTSAWSDYINRAQNFPDLYFASVSTDLAHPITSEVVGNLYAAPGTYRIEVFLNDAPDGSGNGEGKELIGVAEDVEVLGSDGITDWHATLTRPLFGGERLTATATDANNNTSEFSPNLLAGVITRRYGPIEQKDEDHNRWVVNTTYSGKPLFATNPKLRIGNSLLGTPFAAKVVEAVNAANAASATMGIPLVIQVDATGAPDVAGGTPDGSNTAVMETGTWDGPDRALGFTRIRYNALTGEIVDADIAFNGAEFAFQNYPSQPDPETTPLDQADFLAVNVHELLHAFWGMADRYNPGDPYFNTFMGMDVTGEDDPVTMYGIIRPYDIYQREIHLDDEAGLAFIYGGGLSSSQVNVMAVVDGSQSFADPGSYNGFATSKAAVLELIDKTRVGDYVGVQKMSEPSPLIPLTRIVDQSTRDGLKTTVVASLLPDVTDTRPLGSALKSAALQFTSNNVGNRAIIAYTAGNETATPYALSDEVISALNGAHLSVFSAGGYTQSIAGQATLSGLSDTTGGIYFQTSDTTVSKVTTQIWNLLTGYQLVGDSTMPSNAISWQGDNNLAISWQGTSPTAISWQGTSNLAISWQGQVDKGTAAILPAISWQGKTESSIGKLSALSALAATGDPTFVLALIPPGFDTTKLQGNWSGTEDPYGVITPFNLDDYPYGVTYVTGPTYAYYRITGEFQNNPQPPAANLLPGATWGDLNGVWRLVPIGANNTPLPDFPVPVYVSLTTATDVVLLAELDKATYARFEPVRISATLYEGGQVEGSHTLGGGPITNADVYAEITNAASPDTVVVPMVHAGAGVYRAEFSETGLGGTYSLKVVAKGTAPISGEDFRRQSTQSFYVLPVYLNASLFAANSITMGDGSVVHSGDILVNRDAGSGDPGVELYLGIGAQTPAGFDVKADRVSISASAVVASHLYYNELTNAGSITGPMTTPVELPVGGFPPFEQASPAVATATGFTVANGGHQTLAPGIYGDVTLQPGSRLTLTPGSYSMKSLRMKTGATVDYSGTTRVRIRNGMTGDNGSQVIPSEGSSAGAADIVFFIQGTDIESGFSYALNESPKSTLRASVFAPNGTIFLNQETVAEGALLGRDILFGSLVQVSLASAFSGLSKPSVAQETNGTLADASIPTTFVLTQNYPNPFNPSTQIKYGLPRASEVSLVVFNMLGQEVARLVDEVQPEGYHVVQWNGINQSGSTVGSGMYIYRLRAGDFVETRKMMLIK